VGAGRAKPRPDPTGAILLAALITVLVGVVFHASRFLRVVPGRAPVPTQGDGRPREDARVPTLDLPDWPNYTLHVVDPVRMVETRRVCTGLDAGNVELHQAGDSTWLLATAQYGENTWIEILPDFSMRTIPAVGAFATDSGRPMPCRDTDPVAEFGPLPELYPIGAAVRSRDGRYVFYSVRTGTEESLEFTTLVRFDTRSERITGRLALRHVGCGRTLENDEPRVRYLLLDRKGSIVAIAGSGSVLVP